MSVQTYKKTMNSSAYLVINDILEISHRHTRKNCLSPQKELYLLPHSHGSIFLINGS